MVVRDGEHPGSPLEVLMLRRNARASFVGGAHVFPGGAVDPADGGEDALALCTGSDADASARLGVGRGGLAFWVAAVRECFEEAGILLAVPAGGGELAVDGETAARLATRRRSINAGEGSFAELCRAEDLRVPVDRLHYVAHWVTPEGMPRRFDTRFFVAAAPAGQVPAHDAAETVADVWVRPADALARHRNGEMELILPTIRALESLGRHATTAAALDAAALVRDVPRLIPRLVHDGTGPRLLVDGDDGYERYDGGAGYDGDDEVLTSPAGTPEAAAVAARMASLRANVAGDRPEPGRGRW